jgi:peptide/nickel transport system substrate-binding protein
MRKSSIAALAVVAVLALASCTSDADDPAGTSDEPAGTADDPAGTSGGNGAGAGGPVNIALVQDVSSWDPAQATGGPAMLPMRAVYDTLILETSDGELAPMLATEWSYTDDTRTTLELDLRTDVTFSDGTPFDADAVKANLENFRDGNGPEARQLADVTDVEVVADDTVAIHLEQPTPVLEFNLSQGSGLMASPAALSDGSVAGHPVGTGPYEFDESASVAGSQFVFTARDDYWNPDLQNWDQTTFKILSDPTARVNALVSGEVDVASLEPTSIEQIEAAGMSAVTWPSQFMGLMLMDRSGEVVPALGDVRVRQAINYALDRDSILESANQGLGETTSQIFGENSEAYLPDLDDAYPYDPEKARELLAEAGYPDGFTMKMPLAQSAARLEPFITQPLSDIGITVETESVPVQEYQAEIGSGKFGAAWWLIGLGPTWHFVQRLLLPNALFNPFESTDEELTGLLDGIRQGGSDGEAAAHGLNEYLVEQAWFAPWYRVETVIGVNPGKAQVEPQPGQGLPAIYGITPAE